MSRLRRIAKGSLVYHVMNRANGRLRIFKKMRDFEAFEETIAEGCERFSMRVCGYCVMGNHWHLVLWPRKDGDLSEFMKWLTVTHSHRWHNSHGTVGIGHLYQGRFKSFPVQTNRYYLTLMSYVESNPLRAEIVERSVDWPWSSLAIRCGVDKPVILSDGPVELPKRWIGMVDKADDVSKTDCELLATCVKRSRPMGEKDWTITMAAKLGLESTLRPRGRPRIENNGV
jgi:putative transposase